MTFSVMALCIICYYSECHSCRMTFKLSVAKIRFALSVIMLSVVVLSVVSLLSTLAQFLRACVELTLANAPMRLCCKGAPLQGLIRTEQSTFFHHKNTKIPLLLRNKIRVVFQFCSSFQIDICGSL